jgi:hypothetical protein
MVQRLAVGGLMLGAGIPTAAWLTARPLDAAEALGTQQPGVVMPGRRPVPAPARVSTVSTAVSTTSIRLDQITGIVTQPVVSVVQVNPQTVTFTFKGTTNLPPSDGFIAVDVLKDPDLDPFKGINWQFNKLIMHTTGTAPNFTFSGTSTAIFATQQDQDDATKMVTPWKEGGLGRFRVAAALNSGSFVLLPVLDTDKVTPANKTIGVLADNSPNPTEAADKFVSTSKNTPNYLAANKNVLIFPPGQEALQKDAINQYYDTLQIGPAGPGPTIRTAIPTLKAFRDRYFRAFNCTNASNIPETTAKYFNFGDLGLGREMHCIFNGCPDPRGDGQHSNGELACYVENFGRSDGNAPDKFDDFNEANNARKLNHPFATVAMVERLGVPETSPNRVFFVAWSQTPGTSDPAQTQLLLAAKLDNKGYDTSIPGNCLHCHGINSGYQQHGEPKIFNAMFLPFDLDAFKYWSTDPTNSLSRKKQEPAFRTLNRMIIGRSLLASVPTARQVVNGWYNEDLFTGTFNGKFVPGPVAGISNGWKANKTQEQLYLKLIAKGCRTCHITYRPFVDLDSRPNLAFGNFDDFDPTTKTLAKIKMCGVHANSSVNMPNSEQTIEVLWGSAGRAHFFAQFPDDPTDPFSAECR